MENEATIPLVAAPGMFAAKLAALIKRWPGSQRALAEAVGISPQMLSEYLRGSIPKPLIIVRLARELGVEHALAWLLDDSDHTTEPPPQEPSVSRASDLAFELEGKRRYFQAAIALHQFLESAEHDVWERVATWTLFKHDPKELPEQVKNIVAAVARVSPAAHQVRVLKGFFSKYSAPVNVRDVGIPLEELDPEVLDNREKEFIRRHPGCAAINDYLSHLHDDGVFDIGERLQGFFEDRAPFHLARLIDLPALAGHPDRAKIRQELVNLGYITGSGSPAPFPDVPYRMVQKKRQK